MFSEGGIKAEAARASTRASSVPGRSAFLAASSFSAAFPASIPASVRASRVALSLLLVETAAFALAAASGKIPAFLFTAVRALLTF
jgi:hypothetical protein